MAAASMTQTDFCYKKPKQKLNIMSQLSSVFIATILIGMVFSFQAFACSPPLGGPTSGGGSGSVAGSSSFVFYGDYGSSSTGSAILTYSVGGATFTASGSGCQNPAAITFLGTYTNASSSSASATISYTEDWGTGISYIKTAIASPKNNGCPSCSTAAPHMDGDPINTGTGNLYETETDFKGAPSTHLELTRYYNSQGLAATPFGINWRSTYDRSLFISGSSYVQTIRADGRIDTFNLVSGAWVTDPDVTSTLTAVMSGGVQVGWKVVTDDDTTENYNLTGQLTSIVTREGLTTTLTYTSGQLTTVTGPFGHTLTYTYNSTGNVATVTIPDGGVYSYTYDSKNNLSTVTYPDSTVKTYTYTNTSFVNALTGIKDELNNTYATFAYTTSPYFPSNYGLANSSQHAGGAELTTVSYSFSGVTVTDPNSHNHVYTFTTQFGLTKPTALSGSQVPAVGGNSFSYDTNGFISSKTDYNGNITHYVHNALGEETSRTEAYGTTIARTITTTWHSTFHLPLTITEPNRTTTFTYDTNGTMLTKTITAGTATRVWTYTYNTNGQVLTITDPNSNVTTYTYDSTGDVASITDALSHVTNFTSYDADGKLLSMTDPNGLVTSFTYDARGRLKTKTVGSEVTTLTYDSAGNLTKITRPDSSYYSYTYDNAHRLTKVTDALGNYISYTLDAADNITAKKVYDSGSNLKWQRSFTYDSVERLATEVGASSQTTTYGYDSNSNLTSVTDPLSHVYSFTFDALNREYKITNPASGITQIGYDANDHVTSVTDPRSLVTSYTYTGLNNVTAVSSPDTGSTSNTFDLFGNVTTSTDANGKTVTYTYDALNRVTGASYTGGATITWAYDQGTYGIGHLTTVSDSTGSTTWTYDIHGRVTQKQQTTGSVVLTTSNTYDSYGRLTTITYPSGRVMTYTYDSDGRVSSITEGSATVIGSVTYLPFGKVTGWAEGNGASYSRTLDQDGRITGISMGGSSTISLGFTLDNANRITGLTETGLSGKTFGYDSLDRLTSLAISGGTTTSYGYDADSNRSSVTVSAGTTTYNYPTGSNKLSSLSGLTSASYSYDSDGNMTGDGTNSWAYDARNKMSSDTVSSVTTSYGINGIGQRISKNGSGVSPAGVNEYFYDSRGQFLGEYDGSGNILDETVWFASLPVAVLKGTGTSAATYYINPDHRGATHIVTDSSGNQIWTWDPMAFGDNVPNQNPSGLGIFNYNPRFPGQYADLESGLNYNYFRDYSPGIGRYIESDPFGLKGGINTFGYVQGNSVSGVDPYGLFSISPQSIELALGRAGAAEVMGGGPEDPAADIAALLLAGGTIVLSSDSPNSGTQVGGSGGNNNSPPPTTTGGSCPNENPGPIRRLHSDQTIMSTNLSSYNFWSSQSTQSIVDSLAPNQLEPLIVNENGVIIQGNTRTLVLDQRGYPINSLPWTPYP